MAQIGVDIGSYSFNALSGQITFSGVTVTDIEQIKPIVNGERGVVIFNPAEDGKFGTLAGNVLTLEFDTTSQDNTDPLYICVNLGTDSSEGYPVGSSEDVNQVSASTSEVQLLASNASRKTVHIHNESTGTMYILYGSGVTTTNFTYRLNRRDTVDFSDYRGEVSAVWSNTNNYALITEVE